MKAKDVMTEDVIFIELPNTRDKVIELFKKHGISAVPVVKDGKLVGIITRKDILRKVEEDQVAFLMTPNPTTVTPDTDLKEVARILLDTHFRRLPVVENGKLVGIITVRDIIEKISEMGIDKPVKDFVNPNAVCVWQETPLNVAGEIMRLANVEFCPVLDDNASIVGVIDEKILLTETLIEEFLESTQYSSSSDFDDAWSWESIRDYSVKYFEVSVLKLPKEPAKKFMKKAVFVYPQTSVSKAAKEMVRNDLDFIPVIDANGRVVGILPDKNLLRVLVE
ncbi:CBS domain containing protein [Ferroglobus placidus DSM 10642]|uniref:CBS domain containing protein n=1 Tax=Ferroglobus placidus (strain DSM 10642 / AEDII12DO) TaxID=589924 RepID=D3S1B9_FERPA|nr:CBS domain-containing protein [Ferroglobus placidus]ADC66383.1 CBS domain containing protein [Ferroglobus placidus DSM 10642]